MFPREVFDKCQCAHPRLVRPDFWKTDSADLSRWPGRGTALITTRR